MRFALSLVAVCLLATPASAATYEVYNRANSGDLTGYETLDDFLNNVAFGSGGPTFAQSLGTAVNAAGEFYNVGGDNSLNRYESFAAIETSTTNGSGLDRDPGIVDIATDGELFYELRDGTATDTYDVTVYTGETNFFNKTGGVTSTTAVIAGGLRGLAADTNHGSLFGLSTAGNLVHFGSLANLLSDTRVATYSDPGFGGSRGIAILTTVPEPTSLVLCGLGLVGLAAARRRRR